MIIPFKTPLDREIEEAMHRSDEAIEYLHQTLAQNELKINNGATLTDEDISTLLSALGKAIRTSNEEHCLLKKSMGINSVLPL